jgi:hypothetical protein
MVRYLCFILNLLPGGEADDYLRTRYGETIQNSRGGVNSEAGRKSSYQPAEPAQKMDEGDDMDSQWQGTCEERLARERFESRLGKEECDGRDGQDA